MTDVDEQEATMGTEAESTPAATSGTHAPRAGRPHIPGYGIPADQAGLLPWAHVTERLTKALHYWVCTVSADGRPHVTPVDGLWLDDRLYVGGSPTTRRNRNLATNTAVCIHLESATDVVILHGAAHALHAPDHALTLRLAAASADKYGVAPKPEEYATGGVYVVQPQVVFAWQQFPWDATRWQVRKQD